MNYRFASAAELGRAIAAGKADPVELAEGFLAAIASEDAANAIYARTTRQRTLSEAAAARKRAREGRRLSPLDGVPTSWKDLFDTAGTATEAGSAMLAGRVPERDAEVLKRATAAGLVCLGKTHMTELAFSGLGINPVTSTPPNKAMPGHCPGGSSSGAAASLTHGLAALAIGSDTGGSVRLPACWNNLVGLKTTHGLLPNDGVVPLCSGFDTVGPLARCVEDAGLALDALSGNPSKSRSPAVLSAAALVVPEGVALEQCDAIVLESFERALARLARGGARIKRVGAPELPALLGQAGPAFLFEAWAASGDLIEARGERMFAPIRQRFLAGKSVTRGQYDAATAEIARLRAAAWRRLGEEAILAFPTAAILPPRVDELLADADRFSERNLLALRNTRIVNLLGGAAITLPLPETACGLQIAGGQGSEERLLAAAAAMERVAG